jgi:hypothetical protein
MAKFELGNDAFFLDYEEDGLTEEDWRELDEEGS